MKISIRVCLFSLLLTILAPPMSWADMQNYEAIMQRDVNDQSITIVPTSLITWGKVYRNEIKLFNIPDNQNGYIEFWPEHVQNDRFEVALKGLISNKTYAFSFESSVFTIVVPTGPVAKPYVEADSYSISDLDKFRIEKCGGAIQFYKNDILLYEHCLSGAGEAVYHDLFVHSASETEISLVFDDNLDECTTGFTGGGVSEFSFDPGNQNTNYVQLNQLISKENSLEGKSDEGSQKAPLPANFIVTVDAFNSSGEPVRQWKIRTNTKGKLPSNHELWKYIEEGYDVRIFSTNISGSNE